MKCKKAFIIVIAAVVLVGGITAGVVIGVTDHHSRQQKASTLSRLEHKA